MQTAGVEVGVGDIPAEGTAGAKALWLRTQVGTRVSVKRVEDEAGGHRGPFGLWRNLGFI